MNICIDVRPALSKPTGVGVYVENIVAALAEIDHQNTYHLFSSSWKERFPSRIFGSNFRLHDQVIPVRFLNYLWHHFEKPAIDRLIRTEVDISHSPTPLLMPSKKGQKITTVHDLYFYNHPDQTVREIARDYSGLVKTHSIKSDAIIAVSEHTKRQLVEQLNIPASKVYTIRHGVDPFFAEPPQNGEADAVRLKFRINRPYFLFVGTKEPRKNLQTLLKAFRSFPEDVQLVLAGPTGWQDDSWRGLLNDRVIETGYISKSELRSLYRNSISLVLPSLEEGFGLPLLEAMASDTAVIASNIMSFAEVAQNAFIPFVPTDVEQLRSAMMKVCADSALRQSLIEQGRQRLAHFSWRECAQKTLDLYQNL
jgi:glycosyltransferase involved in cell wall biosynthesis